MDDQELLSRALKFDAGPVVHINGWIIDPNDPPSDINHHIYTIESRGSSGWAICHGGSVLNKDGEWEYEPMCSHRSDEFIAHTRWVAVRDAFAFLDAWRPEELKRALDQGFTYWKSKS